MAAKVVEDEKIKTISEEKTEEGKKVVKLQKGVKEVTRLEHEAPSWMISEE